MDFDIEAMRAEDLRQELEKRGEDTRGTKQVLKERFVQVLKEEAISADGIGAKTDNVAGDTSSVRSAGSKSTVASERVMEASRRAGLLAKAAALKKKHELELQLEQLRRKQEELMIMAELEESEAKERVLAQYEDGALATGGSEAPMKMKSEVEKAKVKQEVIKVKKAESKDVEAKDVEHEETNMNRGTHKKLGQCAVLQPLELQTFDGDEGSFLPFLAAFESNVAARLDSDEEKLLYLLQLTAGKPRDIVSTCVYLKNGYEEAIRLLNRRYRSLTKARLSLTEKLQKHPQIKYDDVEGIDCFSILLRGVYNALHAQSADGQADSSTILLVLEKMPWLADRWRRQVDRIENEREEQAGLKDLVEFVETEARIVNNPTYGRHKLARDRAPEREVKRAETRPRAGAYRGPAVSGKALAGSVKPRGTQSGTCMFCGNQHAVAGCPALTQKSQEEKTKFVMSNGLCFGCLTKGHRSRDCKERLTCSKCQKSHPTVLHWDLPAKPSSHQTITAGHLATDSGSGGKLNIVKVLIQYQGKTTTTGAFLDSGSTHSFVTSDLLRELDVKTNGSTSMVVSTINGEKRMKGSLATGLTIRNLDQNHALDLPPLYVLDSIPVASEDAPSKEDLDKWPYLSQGGVTIDTLESGERVGLLIGSNIASVMEPIQVIPSQDGGPYAIQTRYGWIVGGASRTGTPTVKVNRIKLLEEPQHEFFENCADTRRGLSVEDVMWCMKVESSCHKGKDGYEIALPFRHGTPKLDNNRMIAEKRLSLLKQKFLKNPDYASRYKAEVDKLITQGHAEKAPVPSDDNGEHTRWFLPHHGVQNPLKPDKLRVVFDCACKFRDVSLNDELLQGPDLTNPLVHVLTRWRAEPVAFKADIEGMFLQVAVPKSQRDYLRFLWWPDGNLEREPEEFRMTVHLFGAASSPSCANYALHRTAEEYGNDFDAEVARTVQRNFYVDDLLKSSPTEESGVALACDVKELCSRGGFNLTKYSSNSIKLLEAVGREALIKPLKEVELCTVNLPVERALGVLWDPQSDSIGFQVDVETLKKKPATRRGMLSATAACYDPLGIASPCIVQGRMLLQELTRLRIGWDEQVPRVVAKRWMRWLDGLSQLTKYRLSRCFAPFGLSAAAHVELHHFSDASLQGYGTVSYVRTESKSGSVHCSLLCSRARVAPVKPISIPRLELTAAKVAVEVNMDMNRCLDMQVNKVVFWTDSTAVLKYINNVKTRFHLFVANRLAVIHDGSSVDQWRYVPSDENPADLVSRGVDGSSLTKNPMWSAGPRFLQESPDAWPTHPEMEEVSVEDPEVKKTQKVFATKTTEDDNPMEKLIKHYSSWNRLRNGVAWIRRLIRKLKDKLKGFATAESPLLSVKEVEAAENVMVRHVQKAHFPEELEALRAGRPLRLDSRLKHLSPFLDNGLLRVGGRLTNSNLDWASKHPLILPNRNEVVMKIIADVHQKIGHQGRQHVLSALRSKYWIMKANSTVRQCLHQCVSCKKLQAKPEAQKMADLPADRVQEGQQPFQRTGVDYFGHFYVKRGRSRVKMYGVIFTCLAVRAVHLEVASSLSADSFICALRRFIARRGNVRFIRSDQGSNFVGAEREMRDELQLLMKSDSVIKKEMLARNIEWRFNTPGASHHGGAWERLIRSTRKILNALLREQSFSEETLRTVLCEVECVMNNRPLTPVSSDPRDDVPLTPNHILHLRCVTPLFEELDDRDLCGRKRWRQAAHLAEQFWRRWRNEYMPLLQQRPGPATRSRKNIKTGDIVVLVDDSVPRGMWPLGRVEEALMGSDGLVRSVKIRTRNKVLQRPVTKVVKIIEA